jgi:hypothetical protein
VQFIETVERITDASARAIAGHTPEVEQPRIVGMRSGLFDYFTIAKYNSGIIGKRTG